MIEKGAITQEIQNIKFSHRTYFQIFKIMTATGQSDISCTSDYALKDHYRLRCMP